MSQDHVPAWVGVDSNDAPYIETASETREGCRERIDTLSYEEGHVQLIPRQMLCQFTRLTQPGAVASLQGERVATPESSCGRMTLTERGMKDGSFRHD